MEMKRQKKLQYEIYYRYLRFLALYGFYKFTTRQCMMMMMAARSGENLYCTILYCTGGKTRIHDPRSVASQYSIAYLF